MDCLFCKIIAGEIPSAKVYEDEKVFAFRDINPQAPAHILLVPKKHMKNILECDAETAAALADAIRAVAAQEGLRGGRLPRGFQLRQERLPVGGASADPSSGRRATVREDELKGCRAGAGQTQM